MPPVIQYGGMFTPHPEPHIIEGASSRKFPKFREEELKVRCDDLELRWKGASNTSMRDTYR